MTRQSIHDRRTTKYLCEALYVYEHGLRQKSRGRNPSMSYRNIGNPRKAFEYVKSILGNYSPVVTESVQENIRQMIHISQLTKQDVRTVINNIPIQVNVRYSFMGNLETVYRRYRSNLVVLEERQRVSLDFQQRLRAEDLKIEQMRAKITELMAKFDALDFDDIDAVIGWLHEFYEPHTYLSSEAPTVKVVTKLLEKGFFANENAGNLDVVSDKTAFARWIVGQTILFLQVNGRMHGILETFMIAWKMKFADHRRQPTTV